MADQKLMTPAELAAGLEHIAGSPPERGVLQLIVRRPSTDARETLDTGSLDVGEGLVGDDWSRRRNRHAADGSPDPETQLTIINARAIALIAGDRTHWSMAGDQLYVDLDLSVTNLAPGSRLTVGDAEIEVTARPHTGCAKFAARFGAAALRFVNTAEGRELRLRGMYARVIRPGVIRNGDLVIRTS